MPIMHALPVDDLIDHDTDEDGACVCGPLVVLRADGDWSFCFLVIHQPLDGRDGYEAPAAPWAAATPRTCTRCHAPFRIGRAWRWLARRYRPGDL